MGWVLPSSCEADDVCFLHRAARDLLLIPAASGPLWTCGATGFSPQDAGLTPRERAGWGSEGCVSVSAPGTGQPAVPWGLPTPPFAVPSTLDEARHLLLFCPVPCFSASPAGMEESPVLWEIFVLPMGKCREKKVTCPSE